MYLSASSNVSTLFYSLFLLYWRGGGGGGCWWDPAAVRMRSVAEVCQGQNSANFFIIKLHYQLCRYIYYNLPFLIVLLAKFCAFLLLLYSLFCAKIIVELRARAHQLAWLNKYSFRYTYIVSSERVHAPSN